MDIGCWQESERQLNIMNGKEEIEAANIAKRKRVGQQDTPSMKCVSWKQTEQDVSIVLEASTKLSAPDLEPELTDTEVKVSLKDGTRWQCTFNQEIEPEATNLSLHGSRVTIKVKKKQPHHWPALEVGGKEKKSVKVESLTSSNGDRKESQKEMDKESLCKLTHVRHDWSEKGLEELVVYIYVKQVNKDSIRVKFDEKKMTVMFSTSDQQFLSLHEGTSESTVFSWSADVVDALKIEKCKYRFSSSCLEVHLCKKVPRQWSALEASHVKENLYKLTHVKHDWFEKGAEELDVHIYVKQINRESVRVKFDEKRLTVTFSTSNPRFLSMHEGTSENTLFCWCVDVVDSLRTEKCKHQFNNTLIDVHLFKKTPRRWCALEASQVKGASAAHPSCSSSSSSGSAWVTASKGHSSKKTKGITTTDQSKVMFDEMCNSPSSSLNNVGVTGVTNAKVTTAGMAGAGGSGGNGNTAGMGGMGSTVTGSSGSLSNDVKPEVKTRKSTSSTGEASPPTEKTNKLSKAKSTSKSNRSSDNNKDSISQKPTCMVSPLHKNLSELPQLVNLGMTGLENLGNTCFQNSVLQVLANTRELRDYFLDSRFQKDINVDNPLGMGGKLAVAFALLLKVLWSGKHHSYAPAKLKNLIAMKNSLFTGFAQHDAQEFMAYLLDGLHEDLNRIRDKPYTTTVESDGRPDEVVSEEAWNVHKQRNNSFIVDLFQGQYRSKLVCPVCQKVSITFDPFMIVPVPLPKKQRLLSVIFFSKDAFRKPVKYVLRLPKDGTVENLKDAISAKTGVSVRDLRVFESFKHVVHTFFGKGSSLANVSNSDKIYVCEVLSEKVAGEPVVEMVVLQRVLVPLQLASRCSFCHRQCATDQKLRRCTRCYRTAYCDHSCQKKDWSRHRPMCRSIPAPVGEPFIVSLPESQATYSRIVQTVEAYSRNSVDVFQPPVSEDAPASPSDRTSPASGAMATATSPDSDLDTTPTKSVSSSLSSGSMTEVETESSSTVGDMDSDSGTITSSSTSLSGKVHSPEKETDTTDPQYQAEKRGASGARAGDELPVRHVLGRPQNSEISRPPFYLHLVDKDGRSVSAAGTESQRLEDKGEEPLDLSSVYYLGMDWRNNERVQPYVLVQSKDLDYVEDSSVQTATIEESNMTSLDDSLTLFTEPEVLSPEHAWYCPSCKEHREATKQLSLWRLPHTLIIQLKRFSFGNLSWRDKIDKFVDFPTRGLDMSKYYITQRPSNEPAPIYDLYGVINHHGGILGGHYTAYGRCPDLNNWKANEVGWRLFDDSMVSNTSEKQVVTRAAYVLFYRRRSTVVPVPRPLTASTADAEVTPEKPGTKEAHVGSAPDLHEPVDSGPFSIAGGDGPLSLDNRMVYRTASFIDMDAVD